MDKLQWMVRMDKYSFREYARGPLRMNLEERTLEIHFILVHIVMVRNLMGLID